MFSFRSQEKKQAAVAEFALAIRDRIMSKINEQISDTKEVLRTSITLAIVEALSLDELEIINEAEADSKQRKLDALKRKITLKTDSIIVQQTVSLMSRIASLGSDKKVKTSKK